MPFTVISGDFVPEAGRPDGDSIRFRPDDPSPLFQLPRRGRAPKINRNNRTIQLRFEGIDTMESRAAVPYSSDATASNLELCGVPTGVGTARGYVLANQIGPNGRPICFVYPGNPAQPSGEEVFLDIDWMKQSVNFEQITRGHAYPLFYDTLFDDLRIAMANEVAAVRVTGRGVWSADVSTTGAHYHGPDSLDTMSPLFPKLWRRLDKYSRDSDILNPRSLAEFKEYLEGLREERVFVFSQGISTGFDDLVEVNGDTVRLTVAPEEIVVVSV